MSHQHIDDPVLQALEARLAGLTPQLSLVDQHALLYRCAFSAGQQAAVKTTRRWQAAVGLLALLLLGMSIPLAQRGMMLAREQPPQVAPPSAGPAQPMIAQRETESLQPRVAQVDNDAWQIEPCPSDALGDHLAQFQQTDSAMRSLAVAALTRSVLAQ